MSFASHTTLPSMSSTPRCPGSWANTPCGGSSQPGTPDSREPLGSPWMQPMMYMPYDGSMTPNSGGGMVSQRMMPVCFQPTNMVHGGSPIQTAQGMGGTNPSVMQACMVPAAMLSSRMMSTRTCTE